MESAEPNSAAEQSYSDLLQTALRRHEAGEWGEAERIYRDVLTRAPQQPDAYHLLGTLLDQRGDHASAVEWIGKAIALRPQAATYHCNLGSAQSNLGQFAEAEASCRTALRLEPEHSLAWHNLGVVLERQRRLGESEQALRESLRIKPDSALAWTALADVLREQWHLRDATQAYRRALELEPGSYMAHGNLGLLLADCGELEQGLAHCRTAVKLRPDSFLAHHQLGKLLCEYGSIDEAMDELAAAQDLAPDSPLLCIDIGRAWFELADYEQAHNWFERALALDPRSFTARCHIGNVLLETENFDAACEVQLAILADKPEFVPSHMGLARAKLELGDVDGAIACHREAIRLRPEGAWLHASLGRTLSNAGDLEAALACHRKAIELNPNCVPAHAGLVTALRGQTTDEDIRTIERLLAAPWMTAERQSNLRFGLAQAYDGRGDHARAAEQMVAANALQRRYYEDREQGYDLDAHRQYVDNLMAAFTPDYFRRTRDFGSDSLRPVFVVGMPRSGTTLTEQILASHPKVHGAGERPFATRGFTLLPRLLQLDRTPVSCLDQLDRTITQQLADSHLKWLRELDGDRAARVVDKMPDNYHLLGWIATLFPQAKIIHCRRDVRDVALSCWITNFHRIRWANDLEHLADRINQYARLMEHYQQALPVPTCEVDYEQMVADQEGTSRRIVEFVGLPWDSVCLDFHRTERLVRTASVAQVRAPIHRKSVARWRRYEEMLAPLLERLHVPASYLPDSSNL